MLLSRSVFFLVCHLDSFFFFFAVLVFHRVGFLPSVSDSLLLLLHHGFTAALHLHIYYCIIKINQTHIKHTVFLHLRENNGILKKGETEENLWGGGGQGHL